MEKFLTIDTIRYRSDDIKRYYPKGKLHIELCCYRGDDIKIAFASEEFRDRALAKFDKIFCTLITDDWGQNEVTMNG